ncbi:acyltransferase [Bradyrhizobium symbiodeficiens]|uniref:acyltransferase family protein n=1 Tax=Bradyrhizobium symbiodeficiens TaxID=1404367 RepID=UPI0030D4AC6E
MLSLDRAKNDTSIALDLLRAVAAQMVCVGHAWNVVIGQRNTQAPAWGVLAFFILSGFVIAHTLSTKSKSIDYGLLRYAVDRISRIYCAYLPAMMFMLLVENTISHLGVTPLGSTDWKTFLANLAMLQIYPGLPFLNFGASGQTTSIAVEFHIYFFVGGTWFLCIRRNRVAAMIVAMAFCTLPIAYSLDLSGRALFVLWLAGFALYFLLSSVTVSRGLGLQLCAVWLFAIYQSRDFFTPADPYSLSNYLPLIFGFGSIVVISQCTKALIPVERLVRFFADYSLSLFLIHFVIVIYFSKTFPQSGVVGFLIVVALSNVLSAIFARFTEAKYKIVADAVYRSLRARVSPRTAKLLVVNELRSTE